MYFLCANIDNFFNNDFPAHNLVMNLLKTMKILLSRSLNNGLRHPRYGKAVNNVRDHVHSTLTPLLPPALNHSETGVSCYQVGGDQELVCHCAICTVLYLRIT